MGATSPGAGSSRAWAPLRRWRCDTQHCKILEKPFECTLYNDAQGPQRPVGDNPHTPLILKGAPTHLRFHFPQRSTTAPPVFVSRRVARWKSAPFRSDVGLTQPSAVAMVLGQSHRTERSASCGYTQRRDVVLVSSPSPGDQSNQREHQPRGIVPLTHPLRYNTHAGAGGNGAK